MFGANKEKEQEVVISTTDLTNAEVRIGRGAHLKGNIEAQGPVRIDGKLIGDLSSKGKVVLGETAGVEGTIIAQNAEISGQFKGMLEISEMLVIKASAQIDGDIFCKKMVMEAGATFMGNCRMGLENAGTGQYANAATKSSNGALKNQEAI